MEATREEAGLEAREPPVAPPDRRRRRWRGRVRRRRVRAGGGCDGRTDIRNAEAFTLPIGGDHFRSSAVFLTQSHPKQTEGNDVHAGTSLDQLYAKKFGQDTPIP